MSGFQSIKRQLLPLIKGSPVVVITFLAAVFAAKKVINYTPNTYQTIARIKLDDQKYGFSNNTLYKDFDVFSTENKIQSEAMVLKSPLLVGMALDSIDFDVSIFRKGDLKNTLVYHESPLKVEYHFHDTRLFDKDYHVQVLGHDSFLIMVSKADSTAQTAHTFGQIIELEGGSITLHKNEELLNQKKVQLQGDYIVHVHSRDALINQVIDRLDVVEVDKEIAILRIVFKDPHPQRAATFTNALCEAYIRDYVDTKSKAALQTVKFIDKKIDEVNQDLKRAEFALERFKSENDIVNLRQETETGLRQIADLEVALYNLEMNEKAILQLEEYILAGDYFDETAINFGFGDLLMTELVKKLKLWQDERQDLLLKYTEKSDKVLAVDRKIDEVKNYIKEAIKRNKAEIITKRQEASRSLGASSNQFEGLSTKEKDLRILERNFHLLEQVYNFLSQKRIEASIAASANLAFHRIIEKAVVPKKPISPNRTLLTFVSGLLGIIGGIAMIYLRQFALAKVVTRQDVERVTDLPIAGVARKGLFPSDFTSIARNLIMKGLLKKHGVFTITSTVRAEGKSFISHQMAKVLESLGWSVRIVSCANKGDLDAIDCCEKDGLEPDHFYNHSINEWEAQLDFLAKKYDVVIIDAPASAVCISAIRAMKASDFSLYVIRANYTSKDYINNANMLKEEYGIENLHILLNAAHKASNYNGVFVGTRFSSVQHLGSSLVHRYLNTYLR